MKCPHCQVWTSVLRTEATKRIRECANGHRFRTVEMLADRAEYMEQQVQARAEKARRVLQEKGYLYKPAAV